MKLFGWFQKKPPVIDTWAREKLVDILRQLAEVTSERDALVQQLSEQRKRKKPRRAYVDERLRQIAAEAKPCVDKRSAKLPSLTGLTQAQADAAFPTNRPFGEAGTPLEARKKLEIAMVRAKESASAAPYDERSDRGHGFEGATSGSYAPLKRV
jgi:hypothetical protein